MASSNLRTVNAFLWFTQRSWRRTHWGSKPLLEGIRSPLREKEVTFPFLE